MTWQTDNANVVREVFTAKLRAKTEFLGLFQQFLFQLDIDLSAVLTFTAAAFGGELLLLAFKRVFAKKSEDE